MDKEEVVVNVLEQITQEQIRKDLPALNIGDVVKVSVRITEGGRERTQVYEGTIIAKQNGGVSETFTVRRLAYNVGVERVFLVNSPNIVKVEVTRRGKVRRAKLYYLRDRVGKAAKVKEKIATKNSNNS